ncbi:NRPS-like enzyme [Penicillium capsulatum]|uniref:NRPS-like enzyme n=1 Tax=Penicillium capsulatum TaxID=69766 RepID=A0A9W9I0Z2_9EURO|nr:NRPS-like enzyme [Penicillium capsulatum]KAJ6108793.1 NRPS-like enzyme [Penicillium capsulatum]
MSDLTSLDTEKPRRWHWLSEFVKDLRYRIWIIYRRLFSLVWIVNLAALLVVLLTPSVDREWLATIALLNLAVAITIRQDFVINLLFAICCSVPRSWPLAIRRRMAQVYHLGGIHSGCASAAVCWFAGSFAYSIKTRVNIHTSSLSIATLVLSGIALSLLLGMAISAYPALRKQYHNSFERVHRFFGWSVLVLVWVQSMLSIRDAKSPGNSFSETALKSPALWLLIVITMSIATSWMFLKRVPVDAEVLSEHAVRLHFDYTDASPGSFLRLSQRPLFEWHSFATIPMSKEKETQSKGCSVIVSKAGDWTSRQISKPPGQLWVRGVPTSGVMRVASLFRSVVLIGTGSGIGPLLGHIPSCRLRLIWSTPNPLQTFGQDIINQVHDADHHAVIHDTRALGRPDLVQMACRAMQEIEAEAVIIISNETVTRIVVGDMERRGVPAYGAIWDS